MHFISDESSCCGAYSPKQVEMTPSPLYTTLLLCFSSRDYVYDFSAAGVEAARSVFEIRNLVKWTRLKPSDKNSPKKLSQFITKLMENYPHYPPLAAFSILNKRDIPNLIGSSQKKQIRDAIKSMQFSCYQYAFKRYLPLLNKYNHLTGENRDIKWFLDLNSGDFQKKIQCMIGKLAPSYNLQVGTVDFLSKTESDETRSKLSRAIRLNDLLLGICTKCMNEHLFCQERLGGYPNSINYRNENNLECLNGYRETWDLIKDTFLSRKLSIDGETQMWNWEGLFYLPGNKRCQHVEFIGRDPFFR